MGVVIAYWIAASSPNVEAANAILPTFVTVDIFFAGYIIVYSDIPLGWRWYPWTNPMFYGFLGAMKSNFDDSEPYAGSNSVLDYYDVHRGPSIWQNLVILLAFLLFFTFLAGRALCSLANK